MSGPSSKNGQSFIENYPALLQKLIHDYKSAEDPWRVTPYWDTYNRRIIDEINASGIQNLQLNYKLLKGFASGGMPVPIPPNDPLKKFVFEGVQKLPVFSKVFGAHKHIIKVQHKTAVGLHIFRAKQVLKNIEEAFGKLEFDFDMNTGGADDVFEWNGGQITASLVPYLARAADFYSKVPMKDVTSLVEIGPGLGLSTVAHRILNPHLKRFVNVDIPATLYLSTQFLKSLGCFQVVDYIDHKSTDPVIVGQEQEDLPVCYCLPPWSFEDVKEPYDWFHNAYSFMEMEPEVVRAYAAHAESIVTKGVWVMSHEQGHKPNAGNQRETVTLDMIEKAWGDDFIRTDAEASHSLLFDTKPEEFRLYTKRSAEQALKKAV